MILLLSGEGPTDLGQSSRGGSCWGDEFLPGPMALLIEQLLAPCLGYGLIEKVAEYGRESVCFLSKPDLGRKTKQLSEQNRPLLTGLKSPQGAIEFRKNALALGIFAKELENEHGDKVLAVLFRDADKTNSCSRRLWDEKFVSVGEGFKRASFDGGVAMVPKPKSEAWLLCALKKKHLHCDNLEDAPGNDASPNNLKKQLDEHLAPHEAHRENLNDLVADGQVVARKIQMPSFLAFRDSLKQAASRCGLETSSLELTN